MKIFVWEGLGVLEDWSTGLAVVYAKDEAEARATLLAAMDAEVDDPEEYPPDIYPDRSRFKEYNAKEVARLPLPARVIDIDDDTKPFAAFVGGSS